VTATETIYVRLLEEAVDVWRPVQAAREDDGYWRIADQVLPDEAWEFDLGARVRCERRDLSGGECWVATSSLEEDEAIALATEAQHTTRPQRP
jgi:hypothetical protein